MPTCAGKTHAIIIVAEGFKTKITDLAEMIEAADVGFTTRVSILGHIQRGGRPSAYDRWLATRFGVRAVEYLMEGRTGVMTGLSGRDIMPVPFSEIVGKNREMSSEYYDIARMLAR